MQLLKKQPSCCKQKIYQMIFLKNRLCMAVSYPPTWFSTKRHVVEGRFGICQQWKDQQTPRLLTNESSLLDFFGFGAGSMLFLGKQLIWKWDDPTKSFQNHQGWSPPPKRINSEKNTFTLHELAMQGLGRQRPGFQTSGCCLIGYGGCSLGAQR